MNLLVYLILNVAVFVNCPTSLADNPTIIEFSHIKAPKGTIRIGIYAENSTFGGAYGKPEFGLMVPVNSTKNIRAAIQLPAGKYAMAVYHDINDNVVLDRNFVGYPKEPFGFSNNYRPIFSGPKFSDCMFEVKDGTPLLLKVKLIN
jgi:uncharacterized protein (DUF2141 family)